MIGIRAGLHSKSGQAEVTRRLNDAYSNYSLGGQRIAMRDNTGLYFLHGDHLGSASMTTNASGVKVGEMRYTPFGDQRAMVNQFQSDRRFTGMAAQNSLGGVYDYSARMYSSMLGRFLSADTIVQAPYDSQTYNRYAYARNNPLRYNDPSGHCFIPPLAIACIVVIAADALGITLIADVAIRGEDSIIAEGGRALGGLIRMGYDAITDTPQQATNGSAETDQAGTTDNGKKPPNPDGSNGKPDHQKTTGDLQDELKGKYPVAQGNTVVGNKSIKGKVNAATGQKIKANRRPDATVYNEKGEVVEVGEAYRPDPPSWKPKQTREMTKMDEYEKDKIPSVWRPVRGVGMQ